MKIHRQLFAFAVLCLATALHGAGLSTPASSKPVSEDLKLFKAPASLSASGKAGYLAYDSAYFYVYDPTTKAWIRYGGGGGGGGGVSDLAYDATNWDSVTTIAPSKNAVRDKFEQMAPLAAPNFTGLVGISTSIAANTAGNGIFLTNPTAATNGNQSFSPYIEQEGFGWKTASTAASQSVKYRFGVQPGQGLSAPTGTWVLQKSINGGAYSDVLHMDQGVAAFSVGIAAGSGFNVQGDVLKSIANGIWITGNSGGGSLTLKQKTSDSDISNIYFSANGSDRNVTFSGDTNDSGTNTGDQTNIPGNAATATALANARSIYGNSFDGTGSLGQIIASTYGGTGNGFTKFAGPTTSEKTYTGPNSNATLLTNVSATDAVQAAQMVTLSSSATDTFVGTAAVTIGSYVANTEYVFIANTANTGAASINIDGKGAKTIVKVQGAISTTLADNDIRSGQVVVVRYDGTNMQMISQLGNAAAGTGDALVANPLSQFAATSSSQLRGVLSDESGTGAIMTDNGTLNAGTIAGATTVTGTINYSTPDTITITTNAGSIDVTKPLGSATNSAATTLTFSTDSVPATRVITRQLINGDASNARVFTFDTVTDFTVSVPASSSVLVQLKSQGASGWALFSGVASNIVDLAADTTPASTKVMETVNPTTGVSSKSTIAQVVANSGAYVSGGTDVAIADGGTGASTAPAAFDNLQGAEATVASAATTDIGAATSDKVSITGTVTITSFGTKTAGVGRWGRFTGILTLTHSGTALILPGAANITTAAGDRFYAVSLGSGNWVVMDYVKANGTSIAGAADSNAIHGNASSEISALTSKATPTTSDLILIEDAAATNAKKKVTVDGVLAANDARTKTLTNTRTTIRTNTTASSATPTINTDTTDEFTITALAAAITSFTTNLSGTPQNGDQLLIRIKDNGTARAIAWGASFEACGAALPTTTVLSKRLYILFIYDSTAAKWGCVSTAQET